MVGRSHFKYVVEVGGVHDFGRGLRLQLIVQECGNVVDVVKIKLGLLALLDFFHDLKDVFGGLLVHKHVDPLKSWEGRIVLPVGDDA